MTYPRSVADLIAIMRDPDTYPPPVRAVGSNHSVTPCRTAEGGTLVVMRHMNRLLRIGPDTVTAEAGALYIDVARNLQERGVQCYVNLELGNYRSRGYRATMMNVGYRISKDSSALFSCSFHGDVMTLDPTSTGDRGWDEFVVAHNEFCSRHDGVEEISRGGRI